MGSVASSFRAVRAIWRYYPALCSLFDKCSHDDLRSTIERAKFCGLRSKLATKSFVMDMAVMKDVLRELASLSLKMQARSATVVTSLDNVASTTRVLAAMKVVHSSLKAISNIFINLFDFKI